MGSIAPSLEDRAAADSWVCVDGQIDHVEDLALAVGLPNDTEMSQAILCGWRSYGERLLEMIEGDFAIAIWDGERLVLARDALGTRPLHYAWDGECLYVARGPLAIARRLGTPRGDRRKLAAFAMRLDEMDARSFFENVKRLPPGHVATLTAPGPVRSHAWWRPDLAKRRIGRVAAKDEIARLLDRSVAGIAAHSDRPALMLSAGLDSNLLLSRLADAGQTLAVSGGPIDPTQMDEKHLCDETGLARQSASAFSGVSFERASAPSTGIADLDAFFALAERPYYNPHNLGWMRACFAAARDGGAESLVHGLVGNMTVSWSTAPRQSIRKKVRTWLRDHAPLFIRRAAVPRSLKLQAETCFLRIEHPLVVATVEPFERGLLPGRPTHRMDAPDVRLDRWIRDSDYGLYNLAVERGYGLSYRDPFTARTLVEACLTTPDRLFVSGGADRSMARQLLSPAIPEEIREMEDVAVQGSNWLEAARRDIPAAKELLNWSKLHDDLADLFDLDALDAQLDRVPAADGGWLHPREVHLFTALTALSFVRWVEDR